MRCGYIHDRENIEIVLVYESLDFRARGIVGQ